MAILNVKQRIDAYNLGRDAEILALKYQALSDNEFSFYRGTAHLFYEDLPKSPIFTNAPNTWICGDLHLENFGSYKGSNRLSYFDLNDCDESLLAPCTLELSRFLVSVLVGAESLALDQKQALKLCDTFLDSYIQALALGEAYWIERASAKGMIRQLLMSLKKRTRTEFINSRTCTNKQGDRKINVKNGKALPVSDEARAKIKTFMQEFAKKQPEPAFFNVVDIARRIAGTGSLGLERYVILVAGHAIKNKADYYLLDLKLCKQSAAAHFVMDIKQPSWQTEAERVATIQRRLQAISPAFLSDVTIGNNSYLLKELLPTQDRLSLSQANGKIKPLAEVINTMGQITAWAQIRSSGRQGSAITDNLIQFAENSSKWRQDLLDYAVHYAKIVHQDWQVFKAQQPLKSSPSKPSN